ncbi:MAG: SusC/RagA family TonB-linked outer membrane protein, partial [Niabella sp.]|nr:SusC/RagA family TonB-linked outer membrane protein [Niabella sp.]
MQLLVARLVFACLLLTFAVYANANADLPGNFKAKRNKVSAYAFEIIKGTVTDQGNQPLAGVSISVVGTAKGARTAEDGSFSIDVKAGESLTFSRVGYKTITVKAEAGAQLNIKMEPLDNMSEEVVVVGYGTQKKKDVSGAVSTISTEKLKSRPINNVVQALQGLSPDLVITRGSGQPGAEGWNIQLRGMSSLNGGNNPLVIVDGVEYTDLTFLNPSDIASISVLKDAATAAIYGAKAAGGVILITTKSGTNGKVQVTYSGMVQVKHPLSVPDIIPYYQGYAIQREGIANATNSTPTIDSVLYNLLKAAPGYILNDSTLNSHNYFNVNYPELMLKKYYSNFSHNLGVSGGNDKTKYFIGLGVVNNEGMFKVGPDDYKRYNARFNLTTKFNKVLSLDSRISYVNAATLSAGGTSGVSGDYSLLYNIYNLRNNVPFTVPGYPDRWYGNATYATLAAGGYDKKTDQTFDGNFTLKAQNIVPGLVLSALFSPKVQQTNEDELDKPVYAWSVAPGQTAPVYQSVSVQWVQNTVPIAGTRSQVYKSRITQTSYTTNALADYTKAIGDHHLHGLAGFQYQYYNYDGLGATQSNLLNPDLLTVSATNTSNANTPNNFLGDLLARNTFVSWFGRFNYDFKSKYYLEFNIRNDASSRLAPGYQAQTYPAGSVAWRISQEGFFKDHVPFVNELKLRASLGQLGIANLSQYPWQNNYLAYPLLSSSTYPFNNTATTGLVLSTLPSGALGWEKITTKNIGIDFTLLKSRLSGSFDYYDKTNNNMLTSVQLPAIACISGAKTNTGRLETKGWGFELNWHDQIAQDFTYSVG